MTEYSWLHVMLNIFLVAITNFFIFFHFEKLCFAFKTDIN